jgi:lysophospholipase L1-like esterase
MLSLSFFGTTKIFKQYFGSYKTINLGMAGHSSKDTLEYVELSDLNGLNPSNVVLQIGTNDGDNDITTTETAKNIQSICNAIFARIPKTKILLIGPLPRGELVSDRYRVYNREVNKLLKNQVRDIRIIYMDISIMFLNGDDRISKQIMYDFLHLTREGYDTLSEVILEILLSSGRLVSQTATQSILVPRLS